MRRSMAKKDVEGVYLKRNLIAVMTLMTLMLIMGKFWRQKDERKDERKGEKIYVMFPTVCSHRKCVEGNVIIDWPGC